MARRRLSDRVAEAIELGERLNSLLKTLPPPVRETVMRYVVGSRGRRGRPARRRSGGARMRVRRRRVEAAKPAA